MKKNTKMFQRSLTAFLTAALVTTSFGGQGIVFAKAKKKASPSVSLTVTNPAISMLSLKKGETFQLKVKVTPKKKAKEKKPKSEGEEAKQKKKPSLPKPTKEELRDLITTALSALKEPCNITLYTDSRYVMDGIEKWIYAWKKSGWKTANKKSPVKNAELWQRLDELRNQHEIRWVWVKGHAGHPENERCDALARAETAKFKS